MAWILTFFYVFVLFFNSVSSVCFSLCLRQSCQQLGLGQHSHSQTPLLLCYLRIVFSSNMILSVCPPATQFATFIIIVFLFAVFIIKVQLCEAEAAVALRFTVLAAGISSKVLRLKCKGWSRCLTEGEEGWSCQSSIRKVWTLTGSPLTPENSGSLQTKTKWAFALGLTLIFFKVQLVQLKLQDGIATFVIVNSG